MRRKDKKKFYGTILAGLLLLIGLGYAYIHTDLSINGDALFKRATWNIHWVSPPTVSNGSVSGANVTTTAHVTGTNNDTVEYSVTLTNPRDYYEFTVTAENTGTMDAMISTFSNKVYSGNNEITLPDYVKSEITYEDGAIVNGKQILEANSSESFKVKVSYRDDIETNQLPGVDTTLSFRFNVTYVQADNTAIPVRVINNLSNTAWIVDAGSDKNNAVYTFNLSNGTTISTNDSNYDSDMIKGEGTVLSYTIAGDNSTNRFYMIDEKTTRAFEGQFQTSIHDELNEDYCVFLDFTSDEVGYGKIYTSAMLDRLAPYRQTHGYPTSSTSYDDYYSSPYEEWVLLNGADAETYIANGSATDVGDAFWYLDYVNHGYEPNGGFTDWFMGTPEEYKLFGYDSGINGESNLPWKPTYYLYLYTITEPTQSTVEKYNISDYYGLQDTVIALSARYWGDRYDYDGYWKAWYKRGDGEYAAFLPMRSF